MHQAQEKGLVWKALCFWNWEVDDKITRLKEQIALIQLDLSHTSNELYAEQNEISCLWQ